MSAGKKKYQSADKWWHPICSLWIGLGSLWDGDNYSTAPNLLLIIFVIEKDGTDDDLEELKPLHVKEIICGTEMIHHQDLLSYGNLGNLSDSTCDDICIVLEAINENLKEYRVIRDELDE